uniref:BTB domain-containing protein n=1 Tax=Lepeophtheirus salmonis TaxID=72036 RepID=A0A0K2T495_LEPSM
MTGVVESEYILRWNDYSNNFFSCAEELYLRESLTDVTLCVEDRYFDAHRFILSVSSPFFRDLLTKIPRDRHPVVFLKDTPASDIERLLRFMYRGEMRLPHSELESLLETATSLQIRGLTKHQHSPNDNNSTSRVGSSPNRTINGGEERGEDMSTEDQHSSSGVSESNAAAIIKSTPHKKRRTACKSPSPPLPVVVSSSRHPASSGSMIHSDDELPERHFLEFKNVLPPRSEVFARNESAGAVSPPRQTESVPILSERSEQMGIIPNQGALAECRNTGTCYFCKKSFMKNKQLMNHVCPIKPKILLQKKSSTSLR